MTLLAISTRMLMFNMETGTKIKLFFTALGVFFFGVACGTKPNISHEFANCGGTRILDLEPGDVVDLTDAGKGNSDFSITSEGKIFVPDVSDKITDPNAVDYIIGEKDENHYVVKSTNSGNGDVKVTKVCPAPATPTPTLEPASFLRGSQKFAGVNPAFHHGKAINKPFAQGSRGRIFRG